MTEQRWSRIKEVFFEASALPSTEWPDCLNRSCGGDSDLQAAVEDLLRRSQQAPAFESPLRFADLSGRMIGHYRIEVKLGQGGMGVVYKAEDTVLGRTVALKFLSSEVTANATSRARFMEEAKAAAVVDHPNVCTLYGMEEADGQTFLVMSHIGGGRTFRDEIQKGQVAANRVLSIALDVASGLQEAHRRGVVHRDIKPSNILVCDDGRAVITDFGVAQREDRARLTCSGEWIGTPAYMSPEILKGERATPQSDLWSLGMVLYEAAAGRLPFQDRNVQAMALSIQLEEIPRLSALTPELPIPLREIVERMLAPEPANRYGTAAELLSDLHSARSAGAAERQIASQSKSRGISRRSRSLTALAAAAFTVAGVTSWYFAPADRPQVAVHVLPLSSYDGMEDTASFSPDGQQVAFSWQPERSRNSDICVKLVADTQRRCLTTDPRPDFVPSWSPDGRWIAFLRELRPEAFGVFIMSPLGGQERQLTEVVAQSSFFGFSQLAWTPDGKSLIISDRDPETRQWRLWLLSIETLRRMPLTSPPAKTEGDRNPAIAPDGRSLAFVREGFLMGDLYVQGLSASFAPEGSERRITFDNRFVVGMVWAPLSNDILFAASSAVSRSDLRIWRVPADGASKPRLLEPASEGSSSPALSADGKQMAFTRYQNDQNIWRLDRPNLAADWGKPRKYTEISSTRDEGLAVISPDGRRVAFVSNRAGGFDVWVSNLDGSDSRQLTNLGTLSGSLAWSPDSRRIAFDRDVGGNWDIYLIAAEGGPTERLTEGRTDDTVVNWSRDGKSIYFNSNRTGSYQIWKVPASGGNAVQVTHQGAYYAVETVDGSSLVYSVSSDPGPLRILSLKTGSDVEVAPLIWPLCFGAINGGVIYIPVSLKPDETDLLFMDLATRRTSTIATLGARVTAGISISPDERTILYSQRDQVGSDLGLVKSFR